MTQATPVLVDSSVWVAALRAGADPDAVALIDGLVAQERAATCEVVMMEVLRGISVPRDFAAVGLEMRATRYLGMEGAGEGAAQLAQRLRARGLTIPPADLLIAATCALHGAAILHRDKHLAIAAQELGLEQVPLP